MTGEVHPAAGLFPLMSDDELKALAADIKANGLRQPIAVDGDGRILDGRNRLAACKLANVEPQFVSVNGADPVAYVVSLNVKRRNLSKGQTAIAAAEAWDLEVQNSAPGKTRDRLARLFGANRDYVQQARALVERDPQLAESVKSGGRTLADAYSEFRQREATLDAANRKAEVLRERRPDLAERIDADGLSLTEAFDLMSADEARERQQRETMQTNIAHAIGVLARPAFAAADLVDDLDQHDHPHTWQPDDCAAARAFLDALEERLRRNA